MPIRRSMLCALVAGLLAQVGPVLSAEQVPGKTMVDEVVATIDGEPVTRFDAYRFWCMEELATGGDWKKTPDRAALGRSLIRFINRRLLLDEMNRLQTEPAADDAGESIAADLARLFPSESMLRTFLARIDGTVQEVASWLHSSRLVRRFAERRAELYATVSDEEIDEAAARHPAYAIDLTSSEYRKLREQEHLRLRQRKQAAFLVDWLKDLHRRRQVRLLASWAPDPFAMPVNQGGM